MLEFNVFVLACVMHVVIIIVIIISNAGLKGSRIDQIPGSVVDATFWRAQALISIGETTNFTVLTKVKYVIYEMSLHWLPVSPCHNGFVSYC